MDTTSTGSAQPAANVKAPLTSIAEAHFSELYRGVLGNSTPVIVSSSWNFDSDEIVMTLEEADEVDGSGYSRQIDLRTLIPQRQHDRVVIVGFADGHRDEAPWHRTDTEFWGLNTLHRVLPDRPWTRWFEIHGLEEFYGEDKDHQHFLAHFHGDIYVRPQDMGVASEWEMKTAYPYPIERILDAFGGYFTNSVSYMIALAIAMDFKVIELYGVDMAQDQLLQAEYAQQRPSCEFFLGIAAGRGIQIVLPPGSDLLKSTHLYGFENVNPHAGKLVARLKELGARKEAIRQQMTGFQSQANQGQSMINQLDGAMQEVQYQLRNLTTPQAIPQPGDHPNESQSPQPQ